MSLPSDMSFKKILLSLSIFILLAFAVVVILNRDKIVYTGKVEFIDVDCSKKASILERVYLNDQRIRKQDVPFREFAKVDHENQELVVSILEKCSMPALGEVGQKQMDAIWLILQHTEKDTRKKYFPGYLNLLFSPI
ncbi:MAG: hypothetical protein AAFZ63_03665 [Bacteroidota bacterium]